MALNVNFPEKISKFEAAMQRRFLVKRILYKKMFMGKGFEFEKYRGYTFSDDASRIDWKASMRSGESLLVKDFTGEERLKVFLVVDVGENMLFGSGDKIKSEYAAEIAASIAHIVLASGDLVGYALFSERVQALRDLKEGMEQFSAFTASLSNVKLYGGKSNLKETLKFLLGYLRKDIASVFIISDFIKLDDSSLKILRQFAIKFETVGIMVRDPVDLRLPNLSREVVVEDPYTGRQLIIKPSLVAGEYEKYTLEQKKVVESIFKKTGSDLLELDTSQDFVEGLSSFLKARIKRKRYTLNLE